MRKLRGQALVKLLLLQSQFLLLVFRGIIFQNENRLKLRASARDRRLFILALVRPLLLLPLRHTPREI